MKKGDIKRERVEALLTETEQRREEYRARGGNDTNYLDGKIAALEELLQDSGV